MTKQRTHADEAKWVNAWNAAYNNRAKNRAPMSDKEQRKLRKAYLRQNQAWARERALIHNEKGQP